MDDNIEKIRQKIKTSREWALNHFNAGQAENPALVDENFKLVPPSFFVKFPEPDIMLVSPSIIGKPHGIWIKYKLAFNADGSTEWCGKHPFYGTSMKPLKVIGVENV
jgi:hypothetical protein